MPTRRNIVVVALALGLAGCAGTAGPSESGTGATPSEQTLGSSPSDAVVQSAEASTPAASGAAVAAPIPLPECHESNPCTGLGPGTYVLTGDDAFMAGLTVTIPVRWTNGEQDIGEFNIQPDTPPGLLLFVRDITPVLHDGTRAVDVKRTSAGLVEWIRANPDFVTSNPEATTIGTGIAATTLLVGISETAKNADPTCPVEVCVGIFTAEGWPVDGYGYAIGRQPDPLYLRMYFADILTGSVPHTLVVLLDAGDAAHLPAFEAFADPVLDSLHLPPGTSSVR